MYNTSNPAYKVISAVTSSYSLHPSCHRYKTHFCIGFSFWVLWIFLWFFRTNPPQHTFSVVVHVLLALDPFRIKFTIFYFSCDLFNAVKFVLSISVRKTAFNLSINQLELIKTEFGTVTRVELIRTEFALWSAVSVAR